MRVLNVIKLCVLGWVMASTIQAADHAHGSDIQIMDSWARNSAPGAPSAGFMLVKNTSDKDDVLLGVSGDFAKKLELHLTEDIDGILRMVHQKEGIVIPAGGEVLFKPGGYHLMFMGLAKNFEMDEKYPVTLTFKNAGEVNVVLTVKKAAMTDMRHTH